MSDHYAYYNDNEPYVVEWTNNLIRAGHIAPGVVDGRSIKEVAAEDVRGARQVHVFSGIGVWSYALRLAGWPDDVPVWTGSCPCQPFSAAGRKRGTADERHLWPEWFRLIREHRPGAIFGEQVASADGLHWLDLVSVDLESEGYAVGAADLCAASVGAPHQRQRLFFVAYAPESGWLSRWGSRLAGDGGPQAWLEPRRLREARELADAHRFTGHEGSAFGGGGDRGGDASSWSGPRGGGSARELADADSQSRGLHVQPGGSRRAFLEALGRGEVGRLGNANSDGGSRNAGAGSRAEGGGERERFASRHERDATRASGPAGLVGDSSGEGLAGWASESGDDGAQREAAQRAGGAVHTGRDGAHGDGAESALGSVVEHGLVVDPAGLGWGQSGRDAPGGGGSVGGGEAAFDGDAGATRGFWSDASWIYCRDGKWRPVESEYVTVADGSAEGMGRVRTARRPVWPLTTGEVSRVGRIKGYGNAISGPVAAAFIRAFMDVVAGK